jgi:phosphate transport system permease protein
MASSTALTNDFAAAPISLRRRLMDWTATGAAVAAVVLVLAPLGAIFGYLVYKGIGAVNWNFLTQIPKPPGEVDVLNGVPSIVIGIVAYGIVVLRQGHFSALAGGVALAIMMIPTITRATEEMLLLVPNVVREAAYGLGVSRWRTTLSITLRTATSGVITGVMLAFARVAGETAPLLFTAFGNTYWNWKINEPTAALSLQVFTYATSPYDDWHRQAWAGALMLIVLIVLSVTAVRIAAGRGMKGG